MYHRSEFSPEVSEYLFQQIEEIKPYVSSEGLFLIEEVSSSETEVNIILKVKDKNVLFQVESSAENIYDAVFVAKNKVIQMLVGKRKEEKPTKILNS